MGYAESLAGILICLVLLGAREGRWWLVAGAGLLAGMLRPTGVVLALPVAIEAVRQTAHGSAADRVRAAIATAAPVLGACLYLFWAAANFGDFFQPLREQTAPWLRGGVLVDPASTLVKGLISPFTGQYSEAVSLMHLPWIVLAIALLIAGRRLLPPSLLAFSAACLVLALTARHFSSFERYAASAVPLLLVAAALLSTRRRRSVALSLAASLLAGYAFAAFCAVYVP
jgi:hypothetical protein